MFITGTIDSYLKNIEMQQKWQEKKNEMNLDTGSKVVTKDTTHPSQEKDAYISTMKSFMNEQEEFRQKMDAFLEKNSASSRTSVEVKLQYGGKLSSSEMEYIRKNCPDLYAKAQDRERERQDYARSLKNCKNKRELFSLRMSKIVSFMGEVNAAEKSGDYSASFDIRARLYDMEEEHNEYLKSREYSELCRKEKAERELIAIKLKKKKAKMQIRKIFI